MYSPRILIRITGQRSLDHDHVWSRFLKEIVLAPNCKLHEMRAKFVNNILRVVIPYDVATKTRDKPLTAKQIREIFRRHVKDLDNKVSWNELKAAFSELDASYPDFRADRALVFADPNGDGLIASDYEMDELASVLCLAGILAA